MDRNEEQPDRRFWTAYDHFMVEREARALRRRYVRATIERAWVRVARRVRGKLARIAGSPAVGAVRPIRRAA